MMENNKKEEFIKSYIGHIDVIIPHLKAMYEMSSNNTLTPYEQKEVDEEISKNANFQEFASLMI